MPNGHAQLSPSGAARWLTCPASVAFTKDMPDTTSIYAQEGTYAHEVAEHILKGEEQPAELLQAISEHGFDFDEIKENVTLYTDYVQSIAGNLLVEQELNLMPITGEDAHGTADAVIIKDNELYICDLKYGMGVKVDAVENPQLSIYGLAAIEAYEMLGDFDTLHLCIVQPRLKHVSEWSVKVEDLQTFKENVLTTSNLCRELCDVKKIPSKHFCPSEKGCKFCKGKAICKALADYSLKVAGLDLLKDSKAKIDLNGLGAIYSKLPVIKDWIEAIEKRTQSELLDGHKIPGFKLVAGKEGNRKWADELKADIFMREAGIGEFDRYKKTVITPTQAEKLVKAKKLNSEQWEELQGNITRAEAKPIVTTEDDKRPEWSNKPSEEEYPDETKGA